MENPKPDEPLRIRPLRRVEYDRLVDLGVFDDERIELLRGALVEMSPQGAPHADCSAQLVKMLILRLGERASVRAHSPFAATDDSEPEPDVAVNPPRRYSDGHPQAAHLLIEVADSSLRKDRGIKSEIYAEAGVPEYWIVDVVRAVVEVRTAPVDGHYTRITTYRRGESIALAAFPDVALATDEFLPPAG
ncbi:MAG TPA: Uma2 family endonuclease [Kofleriaceae bacterium]|nr:Uma2 family endonuclease [Kofleriaceae bacterium]